MKTIFPAKVDFTEKVLKTLFEKHDIIHKGELKRTENVEERKYAFTLLICLNVTMGMECVCSWCVVIY